MDTNLLQLERHGILIRAGMAITEAVCYTWPALLRLIITLDKSSISLTVVKGGFRHFN